jgi:hypothetical protein
MITLQIDAGDGLLSIFIERYKIWKDCQNFYNNIAAKYKIENCKQGIPCYHYTDVTSINQSSNKLIAIDCLTEGLHSKQWFDQYDPSNHYLIFSNGWWDIKKHDFQINYTLIWNLYFLFDMADTYSSPNRFCYYLDKNYQFDYPKPCYFISTVGATRPERNLIVEHLKNNIKYQNYILRYSGEDLGLPSSDLDVIKFTKGKFDPYISILEKYYHNVSQSLPIKIYNRGYVNFIVESDLDYLNEFFLTEKTIKSLITGQPFIVASTPHFLQNLKRLGFRTYHTIWNEDYDNILTYSERVVKIQELINDLGSIDWDSKKSELVQIQQHNQRVFNNLSHIANTEFTNLENIIDNL